MLPGLSVATGRSKSTSLKLRQMWLTVIARARTRFSKPRSPWSAFLRFSTMHALQMSRAAQIISRVWPRT